MKFQKSSLFEIIALLIILLCLLVDSDEYVPNLNIYINLLLIASIIYEVFKSRNYLKHLSSSEIRMRNKNDSYFNIFPFILGSILCIVMLLFFLISESEKILISTYFLVALSFIIQGLNFIPTASLLFHDNKLTFQNGIVKKTIEIEKVASFSINDDSITFSIREQEEKIILQHLELNGSEIKNIDYFLKKNVKLKN
ncbi:hypothetical protein FLAN108750_04980 [Flavobacterium antarcticum]